MGTLASLNPFAAKKAAVPAEMGNAYEATNPQAAPAAPAVPAVSAAPAAGGGTLAEQAAAELKRRQSKGK